MWVLFSKHEGLLSLGPDSFLLLLNVTRALSFSNSVINPVIYNFMSVSFRESIQRHFRKRTFHNKEFMDVTYRFIASSLVKVAASPVLSNSAKTSPVLSHPTKTSPLTPRKDMSSLDILNNLQTSPLHDMSQILRQTPFSPIARRKATYIRHSTTTSPVLRQSRSISPLLRHSTTTSPHLRHSTLTSPLLCSTDNYFTFSRVTSPLLRHSKGPFPLSRYKSTLVQPSLSTLKPLRRNALVHVSPFLTQDSAETQLL